MRRCYQNIRNSRGSGVHLISDRRCALKTPRPGQCTILRILADDFQRRRQPPWRSPLHSPGLERDLEQRGRPKQKDLLQGVSIPGALLGVVSSEMNRVCWGTPTWSPTIKRALCPRFPRLTQLCQSFVNFVNLLQPVSG